MQAFKYDTPKAIVKQIIEKYINRKRPLQSELAEKISKIHWEVIRDMTDEQMEKEFPGLLECISMNHLAIEVKKDPVYARGFTPQYRENIRNINFW